MQARLWRSYAGYGTYFIINKAQSAKYNINPSKCANIDLQNKKKTDTQQQQIQFIQLDFFAIAPTTYLAWAACYQLPLQLIRPFTVAKIIHFYLLHSATPSPAFRFRLHNTALACACSFSTYLCPAFASTLQAPLARCALGVATAVMLLGSQQAGAIKSCFAVYLLWRQQQHQLHKHISSKPQHWQRCNNNKLTQKRNLLPAIF